MTYASQGDIKEVIDIVAAAGGKFVGRNRFQKTAYFLEFAGLGTGYHFRYEFSSPHSDDLELAMYSARLYYDGFEVNEIELEGTGCTYSVFTYTGECDKYYGEAFELLVQLTMETHPIVLELASVASYFTHIEHENPWNEVERRLKDRVINGWLRDAKMLHHQFSEMDLQIPIALADRL